VSVCRCVGVSVYACPHWPVRVGVGVHVSVRMCGSRFAINFFTSIGLGGLTEQLREHLRNMPKMIMQQQVSPRPYPLSPTPPPIPYTLDHKPYTLHPRLCSGRCAPPLAHACMCTCKHARTCMRARTEWLSAWLGSESHVVCTW